jgi:hypothetical protein
MTINMELLWREAVVVQLRMISQDLPGGAEEGDKTPQSG